MVRKAGYVQLLGAEYIVGCIVCDPTGNIVHDAYLLHTAFFGSAPIFVRSQQSIAITLCSFLGEVGVSSTCTDLVGVSQVSYLMFVCEFVISM